MRYQQRPCKRCRMRNCRETECEKWQQWFLEAWGAVNAYAWAQMDELGRQEPKGFTYELPHMVKSPCAGCLCESWCDTPCSARLRWWDRRVCRKGDAYAAR